MPDESPLYRCEGGTGCSHIIPEDIYQQLSDWIEDRDADLYIVHEDCLKGLVSLKHEGVWCVATEDPE